MKTLALPKGYKIREDKMLRWTRLIGPNFETTLCEELVPDERDRRRILTLFANDIEDARTAGNG